MTDVFHTPGAVNPATGKDVYTPSFGFDKPREQSNAPQEGGFAPAQGKGVSVRGTIPPTGAVDDTPAAVAESGAQSTARQTASPRDPWDSGTWKLGQNVRREPIPKAPGIEGPRGLVEVSNGTAVPGPVSFVEPHETADDIALDSFGRYKMPDPVTGKEKVFRRVATQNRRILGAANSFALDRWRDRTLIKGLCLYPEVADGLDAGLIGTIEEPALDERIDEIAALARTALGGDDARVFAGAVRKWGPLVACGLASLSDVPEELRTAVGALVAVIGREDATTVGALRVLVPRPVAYMPPLVEYSDSGAEIELQPALVSQVDAYVQMADGAVVPLILKVSGSALASYTHAELAAELWQLSRMTHLWTGSAWQEMRGADSSRGVVVRIPTTGDGAVQRCVYSLSVLGPRMNAAIRADSLSPKGRHLPQGKVFSTDISELSVDS